ncbi:M48 family metallopeptidase [Ammoniphilus sp. 3BR4]|uniref:M48 family metallopeptidase n=1 Tax=Ammoniphilus sp. 3BR4 TaxID=3158265 RepID=UPI003465FE97
MPAFQFGTTTIDYSISRIESKKDVAITIDWIDGINVVAPLEISDIQIEQILYKKAPWILKKWSEFSEINQLPKPKEFLSGEKFPYLGRNYKLKVSTTESIKEATLLFHQGRFLSQIPTNYDESKRHESLKQLFKEWYIKHGHQKVKERLKIYCPKLELYPSKLIVKEQQLRWGSCTKNGTININWKILMAPMRVVDYVIVHELAHLKYPDHSSDFWRLVQLTLPDYESRKEWLRINGPTLTF